MRPDEQRTQMVDYTIIPRTLIFVTYGSQILLLKGAPDKKLWANKYNGIGGHLEPGESLLASARRELLEESGLDIPHLQLRGIVHVTMPTPPGIMLFVFVADLGEDVSLDRSSVRPSAEGVPEWIDQSRLSDILLVDDLPLLLPRVLSPGPMVFAHYSFSEAGLIAKFEASNYQTLMEGLE